MNYVKNFNSLFTIGIIAMLVLVFSACHKDDKVIIDEGGIDQKSKIAADTSASGKIITLWKNEEGLTTGYNPVYLSVQDEDENYLEELNMKLKLMMDMGRMEHGAPLIQPTYNASSKLYEAGLVFTMASSSIGHWKLTVTIGGEETDIELTVQQSETKLTGTYTGSDSINYVLTLMPHKKWEVGMNDFSILINKQEELHNFPTYDGFDIEVNPIMTSMGHSSPNNVNPSSQGNGVYTGKVNFTMTGDWRLYFQLSRDNAIIVDSAYVDINF